jgi:hypothetical protein
VWSLFIGAIQIAVPDLRCATPEITNGIARER